MFLPPSSSGGNQERTTDVLVTLDTIRFRGADGGPESVTQLGLKNLWLHLSGSMYDRYVTTYWYMVH